MEIDEEFGLIHGRIQKYTDACYVCRRELIWRLLGSLILDQSYNSHFLVAHIPDKQLIYFQEGIEAESVVRKSNSFTLALTMAQLSHNVYVIIDQTNRVGCCVFVHVYYRYSNSCYYVEFRINNKNKPVFKQCPFHFMLKYVCVFSCLSKISK